MHEHNHSHKTASSYEETPALLNYMPGHNCATKIALLSTADGGLSYPEEQFPSLNLIFSSFVSSEMQFPHSLYFIAHRF